MMIPANEVHYASDGMKKDHVRQKRLKQIDLFRIRDVRMVVYYPANLKSGDHRPNSTRAR